LVFKQLKSILAILSQQWAADMTVSLL